MTRDLDVDRVLEDWLAQGPSRLSDQAIQQTINQLDDIQQRRPFWLPRSNQMHRLFLAATGVAAVIALAVVGIGSLNGSFQVGEPPGHSGIAHISERYGYSVVLPDESWTIDERAGNWQLVGDFFDANSGAGVDYFEDLDTDGDPTLYVYLASQPITDQLGHASPGIGWQNGFEDWVARHDAAVAREQPCFELVGRHETGLVGGETARIGTYRCDDFSGGDPYTTVQIMVAHRGRGYAIYVWPAPVPGFGPADAAEMPVPDLQAAAADWLSDFSFTERGPEVTGSKEPNGPLYTSERHSYTLELPDDNWRVSERPGEWAEGTFMDANSPGTDYLEEVGPDGQVVENLYVYVNSQPLLYPTSAARATTEFHAWVDGIDATNELTHPCFDQLAPPFRTSRLGELSSRAIFGFTIRIHRCEDFEGDGEWMAVQALRFLDGRGYAIYIWPPGPGSGMSQNALETYAADWISRFSFTP